MADTFNSCNQVLLELKGEINVNEIINHFQEVNNAVRVFNTKDVKPTVEELVDACVLLLDQGTEIEEMIEKMEQFGQATYLMANHMRVSQTLLNNPQVFVAKSQNSEGLDRDFKREPCGKTMREYLSRAIVGTQTTKTNLTARKNLLEDFTDMTSSTTSPEKQKRKRLSSSSEKDSEERVVSPKKSPRKTTPSKSNKHIPKKTNDDWDSSEEEVLNAEKTEKEIPSKKKADRQAFTSDTEETTETPSKSKKDKKKKKKDKH
ncbi:hypothetical protein OS493_022611 [Desmophyllum pertusum]|uniref:Uncharacterized protein n=1 Tax=Desmophyllum pertusum TaxID=174260 RepID=A0A9W9YYV1_9CNID|nr:hypothetical protein OS493_022611 [Desmophyllum pertusum]